MSTFAAFWHHLVSLVPGARPVLGKGWVQPENRITREVTRSKPGSRRTATPVAPPISEASPESPAAPKKPSRPGQAA